MLFGVRIFFQVGGKKYAVGCGPAESVGSRRGVQDIWVRDAGIGGLLIPFISGPL